MIDIGHYLQAFSKLPEGAAWAEVNVDLRRETTIKVRKGEQSGCESFERISVYLRASDGERVGTVYTELLSEDPVKLITAAIANAAHINNATGAKPNISGNLAFINPGSPDVDPSEIRERAIQLEKELQANNERLNITECSIRHTTQARRVANSFGMDSTQEHSFYLANVRAMRPRPVGGFVSASALASAVSLDELDLSALAAMLDSKIERMDGKGNLPRLQIPSGNYSCVLSADVVCQIMITTWQEFVADYMSAGKAAFPPAPGTIVGSSCLSIIDSPEHPEWGYSLRLDSEGTECFAKDIVSEGVLVTPLHNLSSAAAAGGTPTGNAGRAALLTGMVPVNIITIPSIIYIKPGEASEEELTEQMADGLLLTYSLDEFHSINIASGEFSIPCGGIVYEGGKPRGTVEQITISGNIKELFLDIQNVGRDLQLREFNYKNYCFGGPSLLIKNLIISSAD